MGIGLCWLLQFMVERFRAAPDHLNIKLPAGLPAVILHRLEAEMDELWSFVGAKANRHWVWIAMDATTCQIIAFQVGDRSGQSAKALWEKIPTVYQDQATFYTDQYAVYTGIIPFSPTPCHRQAGSQDESPRTLQLHVTAATLAAGAHHVVVLEESCQSYRVHKVVHRYLYPHQMCSIIRIALPAILPRGCSLDQSLKSCTLGEKVYKNT